MTKTVKKIKEVVKLNKPMFNEKYKVWVVRMKTNSGWKAVWRKQKEESQKVYDHLISKIVKTEKKDTIENKQINEGAEKSDIVEQPNKEVQPSNTLKKFFTK